MLSNLRKSFGVAVGAGEQSIRINTDEMDDALDTIREVCKKHHWELRVWDETVGTVVWYAPDSGSTTIPLAAATSSAGNRPSLIADMSAPGAPSALGELLKFLGEPGKVGPPVDGGDHHEMLPVIYVLKNMHLALERQRGPMVSVLQHLASDKLCDHPRYKEMANLLTSRGIAGDSDSGKFIVGLMPAEARLPPEVSPFFKVIDHELPDVEEIRIILDGVIPPEEDEDAPAQLSEEVRAKVCKFALGLTRLQIEGVFGAAAVQFGKEPDFNERLPREVWRQKTLILNKEGLVSLYDGPETFDDVVGLDGLKHLLRDLLAPDKYDPDNPELRSRGLCLVGPPRTGKSLITKAAGNTIGLPTIMVDIGAWFGGIVGESERNTRKGFQIIRALAPCIAVIDSN